MLAATMMEIGQVLGTLLGGTAAIIVGGLKWMQWLNRQQEKRLAATQIATMDEWFTEKLSENMIRLATQAGPARTRCIDIAFSDTEVLLRVPVILEQWIALPWGLWVCGVDFAHGSTGYMVKCDNTSRLLTHTHEGSETVRVIQGTMVDLETGTKYVPGGPAWEIPAKSPHSVHFDAPQDDRSFLALVTVRPALPNPNQAPLQLEGLGRLLGAARGR